MQKFPKAHKKKKKKKKRNRLGKRKKPVLFQQ